MKNVLCIVYLYLSIHPSIYLSIYLLCILSIYLFIYLLCILSIYLSIYLSISYVSYLSIYHLSISYVSYISIYVSIYLSISYVSYLSIYLCIYILSILSIRIACQLISKLWRTDDIKFTVAIKRISLLFLSLPKFVLQVPQLLSYIHKICACFWMNVKILQLKMFRFLWHSI
jgi:hypothetical protein